MKFSPVKACFPLLRPARVNCPCVAICRNQHYFLETHDDQLRCLFFLISTVTRGITRCWVIIILPFCTINQRLDLMDCFLLARVLRTCLWYDRLFFWLEILILPEHNFNAILHIAFNTLSLTFFKMAEHTFSGYLERTLRSSHV